MCVKSQAEEGGRAGGCRADGCAHCIGLGLFYRPVNCVQLCVCVWGGACRVRVWLWCVCVCVELGVCGVGSESLPGTGTSVHSSLLGRPLGW